jgi:hypothetical protein
MYWVAVICLLVLSASAIAMILPDNRVWEVVSPLNKSGADIGGIDEYYEGGVVQASENGSSITYASPGSFEGPQGASPASQYLSTRGLGGWTTQNIIMTPFSSGVYWLSARGSPYKAFSLDLSKGLFKNGDQIPIESPSFAGAPSRYQDYYLRDLTGSGGLLALLTSVPEVSPTNFSLTFAGATPNLDHIVVSTQAALTPGAIAGDSLILENLYQWAGDGLQPVNVLPNVNTGETAPPAFLGSGRVNQEQSEDHAVSNDGSRVFWSRGIYPSEGSLYMRESSARTVQIDAAVGGLGVFWTATPDGSKAFFTRGDLYEYDVETGRTADLSGAPVLGVLEASKDGSHVYFVAEGVLTNEANGEERLPVAGGDNLYLYNNGRTTFIATLTPEDNSISAPFEKLIGHAHDWALSLYSRTERLTSDGRYLAFMSNASLTGYGNRDAMTGKPDEEVYLYDALLNSLKCVSCNPSGARPIGPSNIPAATDFGDRSGIYQSRVLSEDGRRVFFNSSDARVPWDTNGKQDVYEYEGGKVSLISGGTDAGATLFVDGSAFVDASANGSDVFFVTRQQLVSQDTDQLVDLYDARENGNGPSPPSAPPCGSESCRPPMSPQPVLGSPGSMTFSGVGNLVQPVSKSTAVHKSKKKSTKKKNRRVRSRRSTVEKGRRGRP